MSTNSAYNAYGQASKPQTQASTPGHTEAWALIEAARRMGAAIEAVAEDPEKGRNTMRDALRLNWRLWTIFQAQITTDSVPLPDNVRINMLTLCKFVDTHTAKFLPDPTPESLATLININRNIASGLLGIDNPKPEDNPVAAQPAQAPAQAIFEQA